MHFTEIEAKLLRLALDKAAHDGEFATAASKLFRQLRTRGVTAEAMMNSYVSSLREGRYENLWRTAQADISRLQVTINVLRNELATMQANTAAPKFKREHTTKYGFAELTTMERSLLIRFARWYKYLGEDQEGRSIRRVCKTGTTEPATLHRLIKKGFVEKRARKLYHGLTAKGVAYYKSYCQNIP